MNMDFTVLENTRGCSILYACHEETEGRTRWQEREENREKGSQGKLEPDMIRFKSHRNLSEAAHLKSPKFTFQKLPHPPDPLSLPGASVKNLKQI